MDSAVPSQRGLQQLERGLVRFGSEEAERAEVAACDLSTGPHPTIWSLPCYPDTSPEAAFRS